MKPNLQTLRVASIATLTFTVASAHAQQAGSQTAPPATQQSTTQPASNLKPDPAAFPTVIDGVLRDFPNNLRNITGDLILAQGETETYASALALPDAKGCQITRYHSTHDTTVSWQAAMLTTDDFAHADQAYRALYQKLQQCYIQLVDGTVVYLKGSWEPAKDGAPFTTSTLKLSVDDQRYRELRVELELVYQLAEWGININIYNKRDKDEADPAAVRTDFTDR